MTTYIHISGTTRAVRGSLLFFCYYSIHAKRDEGTSKICLCFEVSLKYRILLINKLFCCFNFIYNELDYITYKLHNLMQLF